MPTALPVSSAVNTFMQAADEAAMRTALQLQGTVFWPALTVAFKNVTVLTTGSPSDLAFIDLPAWVTRWRFQITATGFLHPESVAGSLAAASFTVYTAAGGTGAATAPFSGPSTVSIEVSINAAGTSIQPSTATRIYLRQTADSLNAGTISVYLLLLPCL